MLQNIFLFLKNEKHIFIKAAAFVIHKSNQGRNILYMYTSDNWSFPLPLQPHLNLVSTYVFVCTHDAGCKQMPVQIYYLLSFKELVQITFAQH